MMDQTWIAVADRLPENGEIVHTVISDGYGARNDTILKRLDTLWFVPDGSMYVYYTPTHWRRLT